MTTRCKFVCNSVTKMATYSDRGKFTYAAKFNVVYGDSPENKEFFASTPTGSFEVSTYREDRFEPGKEYYLDISAA